MDQENPNNQPLQPQQPPLQQVTPDNLNGPGVFQETQPVGDSQSPPPNQPTFNQAQVLQNDTGPLQFNNENEKPPVAAQVLYAFGIIGLIGGMIMALIMFLGSSNSNSLTSSVFGLSSLDIKLAAIILALIIAGAFTLINFIRNGKKWALITYTTIASIGLVSSLLDYVLMSDVEKQLSNSNPAGIVIPYIIIGTILILLWTKNRSYFK